MQTRTRKTYSIFLLSFVIFLFSFVLLLSSCKRSTEPLFNTSNLQLQVLDVSCTEAWLSLKAKNVYFNKTLKLYQDDSLKLEKILTTEDSLLYVDGLWPNTSYQFRVTVYDGNKLIAKSSTVTATTMDTTSHNFTWQTFEFGGQGGSSSFYDVAIIDEKDIWAVGEIYTADDKYNAAHWDGERWELKKITYGGWFWKINTVFAFSHNDVWFSAFVQWNGSRFVEYPVPDVITGYSLNKIWGTSSSDLYVVGNNGLIAHYDGKQWQRIESGINYVINDIYGLNELILCVAGDAYKKNQGRVFKINKDNSVRHLEWDEKNTAQSVYITNPFKYYIAGYKLISNIKNQWYEISNALPSFGNMIRGTDANDIFIACDNLKIAHFNGKTWQSYFFNKIGILESIAVSKTVVVSCGYDARKAYIIMAKR